MTEVRLEDHSFWLVPGRFHLLLAEGCQEMESAFRDLFDQAWLNRVPSVGRAGILSGWRSPGPVFVHLQSGQFFASGKGPKYNVFGGLDGERLDNCPTCSSMKSMR